MRRIPFRIEFKEGPEGLENKTTLGKIEVKAEGEGGILHVKGYALAFGNLDSWGDIILAGACDDFLKSETADRMALCWQHDRTTVIGKITDKGADDYGMWIEADVLPTSDGKDAAILLKAGAVKEFSIGYRTDKYHYETRDGQEIRVIEALTVYEVSPVTIAANPRAKIVSAKNQGNQPADPAQGPDKSNSPTMTPEEINAMRESIEKAAVEKAAAEVKAAQDALKAAQESIEAQDKSIDNLDKSMKSLQSTIDDLKKSLAEKQVQDFKSAFRAELEAHKPEMEEMFKTKADFSVTLELKTVVDIGTTVVSPNNFTSVAVDLTIPPVTPASNPFILAFGIRPRTANKLGWLEPAAQNGADYVAELAANTNKSDVTFTEKSRKFGKLAHTMRISTEFSDWFEQLYNYCVNEGVRMILAKLDQEIWNGLGNDTANAGTGASPNKIYGVKSQATAFSNLGTYVDADLADVIFDAAMQIAKEGFNANAVFCTWAEYATLLNLKDKSGNKLFSQASQSIGPMRVYPNGRMSSGELLVADTSVVEVYGGRSYELEFIRNGVYDAYDVYFRREAQVKVTGPNQKGLIYVDDIEDAIEDINVPGPLATIAENTAGE